MHELGGRITSVTEEREVAELLLQRLSVAIQRGGHASCYSTWTLCTTYRLYNLY